jgi:hypothetical protein
MGCNCKDKAKTTNKKEQTPVEEPVLQVQQDTSLTIDQIQEVHNLLHAINTSPGARNVLIPFIERYLGEKVINYCDQICQKRLESKFNALKKQIK